MTETQSLIDTPEGFVWIFDRLTLDTLPVDDQRRWRDFHEEVWGHLIEDPLVHDGCAPRDELDAANRACEAAFEDGYAQACDDIVSRITTMTKRDGDGFEQARERILAGIARLKDRAESS